MSSNIRKRPMEHTMETQYDKGFTLVELLVVVVILCILATITVFTVRGISGQSQSSACKTAQTTTQYVPSNNVVVSDRGVVSGNCARNL